MEEAIEILETQRANISAAWLRRVREEVPASRNISKLSMRDHLPVMLDYLTSLLREGCKLELLQEKETYHKLLQHSYEHGRHRSTSPSYTMDQILREYIIFHEILSQRLQKRETWNQEVGDIIKFSLENAMLHSATAFHRELYLMRQKLLGMLVHDLRNPISSSLLTLDLMNLSEDAQRIEDLKGMGRKSLKRALKMLEGLLDSVAVQAGQGMTLNFEKVDILERLHQVYLEAVEIYSNDVRWEANAQEIVGVFDATMLRRVLENFLTNAIKYGDSERPITLSINEKGDEICIRVHNWGNPIPEEKQKEIFDFLKMGEGVSSGKLKSWGMGLSLVKAISKGHSGRLELKSSTENGTSFSLYLNKFKNKPGRKNSDPSKG